MRDMIEKMNLLWANGVVAFVAGRPDERRADLLHLLLDEQPLGLSLQGHELHASSSLSKQTFQSKYYGAKFMQMVKLYLLSIAICLVYLLFILVTF